MQAMHAITPSPLAYSPLTPVPNVGSMPMPMPLALYGGGAPTSAPFASGPQPFAAALGAAAAHAAFANGTNTQQANARANNNNANTNNATPSPNSAAITANATAGPLPYSPFNPVFPPSQQQMNLQQQQPFLPQGGQASFPINMPPSQSSAPFPLQSPFNPYLLPQQPQPMPFPPGTYPMMPTQTMRPNVGPFDMPVQMQMQHFNQQQQQQQQFFQMQQQQQQMHMQYQSQMQVPGPLNSFLPTIAPLAPVAVPPPFSTTSSQSSLTADDTTPLKREPMASKTHTPARPREHDRDRDWDRARERDYERPRDRERERDRERGRDRDRDRERDRIRDRDRERERDRPRDRERDRERGRDRSLSRERRPASSAPLKRESSHSHYRKERPMAPPSPMHSDEEDHADAPRDAHHSRPASPRSPRSLGSDADRDSGSAHHEDDVEYEDEDDDYASDSDSTVNGKPRMSHSASRARRPRTEPTSVPADQQSIIVCGVAGRGDEREFMEDSEYFQQTVDVYTALDDPQQRTLYRASALAHKFRVATNQVGMYLVRRRHQHYVNGLYQATAFQAKPAGRTGLKAGGYFVSREVCEEFEQYMKLHSKHSRHRARASTARRARPTGAIHKPIDPARVSVHSQSGSVKLSKARRDLQYHQDALDALLHGAQQTSDLAPPRSASPNSRSSSPKNHTSSVKVQSSQDHASSPALLLHAFATVSMLTASSMQSASTTAQPTPGSTGAVTGEKRKSMDDTPDANSLALSTHRTPSPQRDLSSLTVSGEDQRPVVEVYRRSSGSHTAGRTFTTDEDLTDADASTSTSHTSSATSSTASSQAGTPITPVARLAKPVAIATAVRPKLPPHPVYTARISSLPSSTQTSPCSMSQAPAAVCAAPGHLSLQSLSNSPSPSSSPSSPDTTVASTQSRPTQQAVRSETPDEDVSPPSKRRAVESPSHDAKVARYAIPSVIPAATVAQL